MITSEVTENNYHGNIIKNSTIGAFNGRFANNNITDNKFEETGFTFLVTLMDDNDDYNATQMSGNTLDGYPITVQIGKTDLIFDNPMGQIIAVNSTNININADVTDIHTSRTSGVKISGKLASPLEISKIKITGSEDSSILNAKISELNISADKNNTITNVHVSSFLRIRSYNSSFTNLYTETLENAEFLGSNLTITDSKFDQIELRLLYDSKFSNNIINAGNVFPVGVMVASGSNNIISNNKVIAAQEYGIELQEDTSDNIITANEFISNPKLAQIKDDGTDNQIEKNSYDDWLHPDDNDDGFVDIPYKVIGTANNADPLPLTDNSHTLTTPSFISSPESSASGDITVSWSTAESNYNLTVYYSLYLIKDGKVHETIIDESKLTSVDVNLDDKTVGSEFKFRLNITAGNLDSTIETDLFTIADKPTSNTSSISTPTNEQSDGGFTIPFNTVVMIFVIIAISVVRKLSK